MVDLEKNLDAQFFVGNRERLAGLVDDRGPIVIAANGLLQRSGDTTFPFRQDSSFYYLTGINEPDLLLVIDGSEEYIIVPKRIDSKVEFDGALDFAELSERSGVKNILDEKAGWQRLKVGLARSKSVSTLASGPAYIGGHYGFYANPARSRLIRKLRRLVPGLEIIDIRKVLAGMRVIKQSAEIAVIQKAIDITNNGIEKISKNLSDFSYEYEIEAELNKQFRLSGSSGHAFTPIVAAGANACTIHHIDNNSAISREDFVMLDVGAEVDNYAADIARTLKPARPSSRQQAVYDAVQAAQNYIIGLMRPGAFMRDLQAESDKFIGKKLIELGLINKSDKDSVRKYYNHAIGHFLGLDAHDAGDYRQLLEENMIVTCEPGIYISEEGIGVRIEDDILITKNSNKVMSHRSSV